MKNSKPILVIRFYEMLFDSQDLEYLQKKIQEKYPDYNVLLRNYKTKENYPDIEVLNPNPELESINLEDILNFIENERKLKNSN
jgi:predicted patatin/cPLA2 family phospholipase